MYAQEPNLRQIRLKTVADKLGCSVQRVYELMKEDKEFPIPTRYTARWVSFFECEIDAYIIKKAAHTTGESIENLTERLLKASVFCYEYNKRVNKIKPAEVA